MHNCLQTNATTASVITDNKSQSLRKMLCHLTWTVIGI